MYANGMNTYTHNEGHAMHSNEYQMGILSSFSWECVLGVDRGG